jgi:hypothetical protein
LSGKLYHLTDRLVPVICLLEKQKEFYKNAKNVKKYKKLLKQQSQQHDISLAISPLEVCYDVYFIKVLDCFVGFSYVVRSQVPQFFS